MSDQLALTRILTTLEKDPKDATALKELDRIFERMVFSEEQDEFEFGYAMVERSVNRALTSGSIDGDSEGEHKIAS